MTVERLKSEEESFFFLSKANLKKVKWSKVTPKPR